MPAQAIPPRFHAELLERAMPVRVVFFDVDGVLTDGGVFFGPQGEALKRFHTLDGYGLRLLQRAGITPAVITGRDSAALRNRLASLNVQHAVYGCSQKFQAAERILATLGLSWQQAGAMGDDWPDLAMLQAARLAVAPAGAHAEVRAMAHYITATPAGQGAARECCDLLLMATGHYGALLQQALATDAGTPPAAG